MLKEHPTLKKLFLKAQKAKFDMRKKESKEFRKMFVEVINNSIKK